MGFETRPLTEFRSDALTDDLKDQMKTEKSIPKSAVTVLRY